METQHKPSEHKYHVQHLSQVVPHQVAQSNCATAAAPAALHKMESCWTNARAAADAAAAATCSWVSLMLQDWKDPRSNQALAADRRRHPAEPATGSWNTFFYSGSGVCQLVTRYFAIFQQMRPYCVLMAAGRTGWPSLACTAALLSKLSHVSETQTRCALSALAISQPYQCGLLGWTHVVVAMQWETMDLRFRRMANMLPADSAVAATVVAATDAS